MRKRFANIGLVHCNQGRYPEALEHYELALEIAREVGDRRSEGAVLCNAAGVYLDRGQYEHALNQYRLANAIAREVGNQRGEGQSLGNMGSVYLEQGRFGEAMDHYKAARKILGEAGDEYAGYWRTYVGRAERMIGAVDDARTTQEECLSLLRDIGIQAALGECLCERGHLRLHAGEDAVAELSEARAIAAELGVQPTTALGKAVDRLTRAAEAQSRGETLYYGQCLDDYPEGVRDALRRS
jgi:tetratricopeptide (TPR) repeat protein